MLSGFVSTVKDFVVYAGMFTMCAEQLEMDPNDQLLSSTKHDVDILEW